MRAVDIIMKKRDGYELSREEIAFFMGGYAAGEIPGYQVSAWAMAVFFKGMTSRETAALTEAMLRSGKTIDLSDMRRGMYILHLETQKGWVARKFIKQ